MAERGWFGERKRHSDAARLGWRRRGRSRGIKDMPRSGRSILRGWKSPAVSIVTGGKYGILRSAEEDPEGMEAGKMLAREYIEDNRSGGMDAARANADRDYIEMKRNYKATGDPEVKRNMEINEYAQFFMSWHGSQWFNER